MQRTILHIDFDSFFASVEQQLHPEFRGKPLGVTAANGRNCIIAASREAKKMGIKSPSTVYEARKIVPNILLTKANFNTYWEISKKFIKICDNFSPDVEVFSLDELFMDVTLTAKLFGGVDNVVHQIKEQIRKEIGEYITVSVGISHNKLLAKLASGLKKPSGVVKIAPSQVDAVYKIAKLTDICGIGERIKKRLNRLGIYTLLQLQVAPLPALIAEFGNVEGHVLKDIGMGEDPHQVMSYFHAPEVKSVGRNYCLPNNEYDKRIVLQNIYELWEEISIKLRRLKKKARTVGFYMRGEHTLHARKTFQTHFQTGRELFDVFYTLLDKEIFRTGYVRQIGVWVSSLADENTIPESLFSAKITSPLLQATIDRLNEKYGDHTIRNGFLLHADKLTTVPNGFMGDRYERVKLAQEAASYA